MKRTQDCGAWDSDVVEEQLGCVLSFETQLLQLLALFESRHALLDEEEGNSVRGGFGLR